MLSTFNSILTAPFNPRSLNPALWLDGADPTTMFDATTGGNLVAAGGGIARWEDKSGNARHATQATATSRPIRQSSARNGLDAVRFDGINDIMTTASLGLSGPVFTTFAVHRYANTSGDRRIVQGDNNGGNFDQFNGRYNMFSGATGIIQLGTVDTNYHIATCSFNGNSTSNLRIDRAVIATANVGSLFPSTYRIGATSTTTNLLIGDICEILLIPNALNSHLRESVERYLSQKWNIPLA